MKKYPDTYIHLTRLNGRDDIDQQTLGEAVAYVNGSEKMRFKTMELPWKNNQRRISCIPAGRYKVVHRRSQKYKLHFHITDVPDRSYILIHPANFSRQLMGCIAPGRTFADIDGDGLKDVTHSGDTMNKLLSVMPESFEIIIENAITKIGNLNPKTEKRV